MKYAGFVGRGTTDCNIFQGQPDATSFDDWWAQANDRVEEMRLSSAGAWGVSYLLTPVDSGAFFVGLVYSVSPGVSVLELS